MLKNFFSFVGLTMFLLLTMMDASFAAPFKFPNKIHYDIFVNGSNEASSTFSFVSKKDKAGTPVYQLSFGNFQALGFTSRDKIYTVIFQKDLSLSRTVLMRGNEKFYEMKAKKGSGMFDDEAITFIYAEDTLTGPIETEPYTPYPVIDLLSLFLVASESVATNKGQQNFSFFVKKSTEIVKLIPLDKAEVSYQGAEVSTTVMELSHQGREILKLNIYRDKNGFHFPLRLSIKDEEQGLVEFRATKAY
ncbi:MAG: hypothetical protein DRQ41_07550 [Gammaproteobacteria bacterium]|nr:MAG: hypothetical protein DRQ41_07550 [Gammaproteobacteria bacterium]RKZ73865.1 MAG: hypothetical protein DRQ57_12935 [Gammaproteobacteria bacterium]